MVQMKYLIISCCLFFWILFTPFHVAVAKIDLISLNKREHVAATIYKKADLTLIRDSRMLQFSKGTNLVQFSWAGTGIDPTSLSLQMDEETHPVNIIEISYPPGTRDMGIWKIEAESACRVPVDITYFTSGLSWTSHFTLLLSKDLTNCTLVNHVDITNTSGENYTDTQTRLVVGRINLLDNIRELSSSKYPYGRPMTRGITDKKTAFDHAARILSKPSSLPTAAMAEAASPPDIKKQGLADYFLYAIGGRQTFPDGWTKRLESFRAENVKADWVYRYDKKRYGKTVTHFIRLKNDKDNHLGTTPLPGGKAIVFLKDKSRGQLEYLGTDHLPYIPIGKTVELNLGSSDTVRILPKIVTFKKKNLLFTPDGTLTGFDEVKTWQIEIRNFSDNSVQTEYFMHFNSPDFKIDRMSHSDSFQKVDHLTIAFKIGLAPHTTEQIDFEVTIKRGEHRW